MGILPFLGPDGRSPPYSRDENGFKCHTQSESHVRQILIVGENAKQHVDNYSNQFKSDFLSLVRTSHGEKKVNANHFYQEYIANKEHIHMTATRWVTLTEFVKYLGREGICRVEEGEKGFFISWIDNTPEALQRQEAIRKKDRMDRGDEEREQKAIQEQIDRAKRNAEVSGKLGQDIPEEENILKRESDEGKVKLAFGTKTSSPPSGGGAVAKDDKMNIVTALSKSPLILPPKKSKNVFTAMTKKKVGDMEKVGGVSTRPMSEAERIMKEELGRKRSRDGLGGHAMKKQRII